VVSGTGAPCGSGSGAVNSVSNADGSLTISPTTGAVVASLAVGHTNAWTVGQFFTTTTLNGAALTIRGDATSTLPEQLMITGQTDNNMQLAIGYHTGSDYAQIQAIHQGSMFTGLLLQPDGGNLCVQTAIAGCTSVLTVTGATSIVGALAVSTTLTVNGVAAFPGGATVPTRAANDNTTNAASTAFVTSSINGGLLVNSACTGKMACIASIPTAGAMAAWYSTQNYSGTTMAENNFFVNSDNVNLGVANNGAYWNYSASFGGSAMTGSRIFFPITMNMTMPSATTNVDHNFYVAFAPRITTNVDDNGTIARPQGYFYAMNPQAFALDGALNIAGVVGAEVDFGIISGTMGASAKVLAGFAFVNQGNTNATLTAANAVSPWTGAVSTYVWFYNGGSVNLGTVIEFGVPNTPASFPGANQTTIHANPGSVAYFIDVRNLTVANCSFAAPGGVCIDGSGDYVTTAVAQIMATAPPPNGGAPFDGYLMTNAAGFGIFPGINAPTLTAGAGSLYLRHDAGAIYFNTTGANVWQQLASTQSPTIVTPTINSPTVTGNSVIGNSSQATVVTINGIATGAGAAGGVLLQWQLSAARMLAIGNYSAVLGGSTAYNPGVYFFTPQSSGFFFGVNAAGDIAFQIVQSGTAATSSSTGTLVVNGGLGVGMVYASLEIVTGAENFAGLPPCNAGRIGGHLFVVDNASAIAYNGAVTGGGSNRTPVYCDGQGAWKQGANDNFPLLEDAA
jgi:hypothetical protein